jgi:molecular chaperone DnaK (HSP70)
VKYVVGIDLGTTNCAMASVELAKDGAKPETFAVEQMTAPGERAARPTLPSFLYLAAPNELPPSTLPFGDAHLVGELARDHGWKTPIRLVSSAKSWLCHSGVDRDAPILPWQAPSEVPKVSPIHASSVYLAHLRAAWDYAHPHDKLADQDIFLTVPASFDAAARELTVRAASEAGLARVTLLEEPQAAFYAWLAGAGDGWRKQLAVGDTALVCDVGGGTTDFSLISVAEKNGSLILERVAVGDHILLGGDNMDLSLAHQLKARLETDGQTLDNWQMASLTHACRRAKEELLTDLDKPSAPVAILGRGTRLVGGTLQTALRREDLNILLDGFFPVVDADARPTAKRGGLRERGLPYAADAGVTRHLAAFLAAQQKRATCVLFNGGVMKAAALRRRVVETLDGWSDSPEDDLNVLGGTDLDLAVAHGAAYYGLVRRGKGVRIKGGAARAYYIGIESASLAVPGMEPPLKALCVAAFGMEEGTEAALPSLELGLIVGEPVQFRFLSSSVRKNDAAGTLLEDARAADLAEAEPVSATLPSDEGTAGAEVPVTLRARLTEVGTLELWCDERSGKRSWKLEYNVRS